MTAPRAPQGEHTFALPIRINPENGCLMDANDCYIENEYGALEEEHEASRPFIVRAVNSHAALVAALRACVLALDEIAFDAGDVAFWNKGGEGYEACQQARDALAAVEGD